MKTFKEGLLNYQQEHKYQAEFLNNLDQSVTLMLTIDIVTGNLVYLVFNEPESRKGPAEVFGQLESNNIYFRVYASRVYDDIF